MEEKVFVITEVDWEQKISDVLWVVKGREKAERKVESRLMEVLFEEISLDDPEQFKEDFERDYGYESGKTRRERMEFLQDYLVEHYSIWIDYSIMKMS